MDLKVMYMKRHWKMEQKKESGIPKREKFMNLKVYLEK